MKGLDMGFWFWYNVAAVVLNLFAVWFLVKTKNSRRWLIPLNLGAAALSAALAYSYWR